jgi:hypothetical protein
MIDQLHPSNLKDLGIALVAALLLAALVAMASGCGPQQSGASMTIGTLGLWNNLMDRVEGAH